MTLTKNQLFDIKKKWSQRQNFVHFKSQKNEISIKHHTQTKNG